MADILIWKPLDAHVLAVAVQRLDSPGAWKAYIGAVPGVRHEDEIQGVASLGNALEEKVARAIFPEFDTGGGESGEEARVYVSR